MNTDSLEDIFSRFVVKSQFADIPPETILTVKRIFLNNLGTIIAGAKVAGIKTLVDYFTELGGKPEATILMYGGRVPACNAGFLNSVMDRALDFDDSMMPGAHIGASAVPVAMAVTELRGGCSGRDFLTALALGIEISARLNLSDEQYNGFDPTGICGIFASAAVAGRLLGLTPLQVYHALALAFNRAAGSYQSHISGALAVRLNQGFVSQAGIQCAQLSQLGMTGPNDFLNGIYGYFHLYGKSKALTVDILDGLGKRYELTKTMFKKYPSCGGTQGSVDIMLSLMREHDFSEKEISSVDVYVTPATYRLVGKKFQIGANPRVDAQFNIQYCITSVLLRKSSQLEHFDEVAITDPRIFEIVDKIHVFSDPRLDASGLTAVRVVVKTMEGKTYRRKLDVAPGFPGNPLREEDHYNRFRACIEYAADYFPHENVSQIVSMVDKLEEVEDIRIFIPLLRINNNTI